MASKFNIDTPRTLHSILFILDSLESGVCDMHKIFKILYFADQKHLTLYGVPITGDSYIAMKNGPVPSNSYYIFKFLRGDKRLNPAPSTSNYADWFKVEDSHWVTAQKKPDLDELSESHLECLSESIETNKGLSFIQLVAKSHQMAWENARSEEMDEMDVIDIAKEGGANDEMIQYIHLNLENQNLLNQYAAIR